MSPDRPLAVVKGAGDLATGVIARLHRAGFEVVATEVATPTVIRRTVAFAEAVPEGRWEVEGLVAVRAEGVDAVRAALAAGEVPVLVDPSAKLALRLSPLLLVDAIVAKRNLGTSLADAPAVVALGPGFRAGVDVHAVVETMRGHDLGRVIWAGAALPNTGLPGEVGGASAERVLRAPRAGVFVASRAIGDRVSPREEIGRVDDEPVVTTIAGVLRGVLRSGLTVTAGFKVADVDPRADVAHCFTISDKALAVGGGVLEAAGALLGGFRVGGR